MKWIGQHIYDLVARFRNNVYISGDLTVTGDTTHFSSANADDPVVKIENKTNDAQAARLQFIKNRVRI